MTSAPCRFLAYVRANPGKISWGSSGIAGPQHLGGMHLPKSPASTWFMCPIVQRTNLQALLANEVQLTFDTPTLASPHIQSGALTALAVTGDSRLPKLSDVLTMQNPQDLDYSTDIWIFVLGPEGNSRSRPGLAEQGNRLQRSTTSRFCERLTGFGLEVTEGGNNTVANLKETSIDSRRPTAS